MRPCFSYENNITCQNTSFVLNPFLIKHLTKIQFFSIFSKCYKHVSGKKIWFDPSDWILFLCSSSVKQSDEEAADKRVVDWINKELPNENCQQLKDLRNGISFCRLMNKFWPGSVARSMVLDPSENPIEYRHNFRVLQRAFDKVNMPFMIDLEKLVEGDPAELKLMAQALVAVLNVFEEVHGRSPY